VDAGQPQTLDEGGFTFIEVVIAVSLLAASAAIIIGLQGSAIQRGIHDKYSQIGILIARRLMASLETNEQDLQPFEQSGRVVELLSTFKMTMPDDKDEIAVMDQLQATVRIEPWGIPSVDPDAMRKITIIVSWSSDPYDAVRLMYFAPNKTDREEG
jgi:type II secretory pathway pseudopilin PulG